MVKLVHIISYQDYEKAKEERVYEPASLHSEGFIHLSTEEQVNGTLNRYYSKETSLLILILKLQEGADVRYEAPVLYDAKGMLFPHLYRALSLSEISQVSPISKLPNEEWNVSF